MTDLTDAELDDLIAYTGLDLVLQMPTFTALPVVFFYRNKQGRIMFTTIVKRNLAESIF